MKLYHTGYLQIPAPDIKRGRANADFGQGFYTTPDEAFARRWARTHKGQDTVLNIYELDVSGLNVKEFARNEDWFKYIRRNRAGQADAYPGFDVITGPIANDTIYDTWGIITGGLLTAAQAMQVLTVGPQYVQTVLKTEKAAGQLKFISAAVLDPADVAVYRETVKKEEAEYQRLFAEIMETWEI